jgi:hypothetical protein
MLLSPHFTLEEFLVSETAARKGINNTPTDAVVANLKRLAERLELVRAIFNAPVVITSGYRSPELNEAVGGVKDSAHRYGRAADFIVPGMGSPLHIAQRITKYSAIDFDQLINEYDSWVHFGIEPEGSEPRRQTLTYKRGGQFFPFLC